MVLAWEHLPGSVIRGAGDMRAIALACLVFSALSAVTLIRDAALSWPAIGGAHLAEGLGRMVASLVLAAFWAWMTYGIQRRVLATWILAWFLVVGGYLMLVFRVCLATAKYPLIDDRWIPAVVLTVAGAGIVFLFCRWWVRQRGYFEIRRP